MRDTYTCTLSGLLFVCTPPTLITALAGLRKQQIAVRTPFDLLAYSTHLVLLWWTKDKTLTYYGSGEESTGLSTYTPSFSVWGVATA